MQSFFYCFNTNVVLTNITYQVLLFFFSQFYILYIDYGNTEIVSRSDLVELPEELQTTGHAKKYKFWGFHVLSEQDSPIFSQVSDKTGLFAYEYDLNASDICLPLNVLLWLSYCVVTRGSPFFIIWFMGKSCVCIKSRLALMEPSWLKPSRGILTLVRNCWNSSSPKSVFQETGRTPFPQ